MLTLVLTVCAACSAGGAVPERDRGIPERPQCGVVNSITARYDWRKRIEVIASRRRPLRETVCDLVCVCVCSIYSVLCTEPHAAKIAMQQFASVSVTRPRQLWRPRLPSGLYEELLSTLVSAADMMRCPRRKVHRSIKVPLRARIRGMQRRAPTLLARWFTRRRRAGRVAARLG